MQELYIHTYDAFGNSTDGIKDRLTSYGYTGRYYESEIGLYYYYYRNRFYDPHLGRFISPDPLLFVDGPNLYTYVTNNPQGFRDPYGLNTDDNEPYDDDPYGDPPFSDPPYSKEPPYADPPG